MLQTQLFSEGGHSWYAFCRDPEKAEHIIDTNEYLIVSGTEALALDPGGTEIFPQVVSSFSEVVSIDQIKYFFASHQDPDIISSLPLWMGMCRDAKIYMPWLWAGFIAHFGHEYAGSFEQVPDEGMDIRFANGKTVTLVPAHYCHSSGNFSLYDPTAKILFSGDIGAALLPPEDNHVFVEDFSKHIRYMEGFHRRWMPSNKAKNQWVARVRELDIKMLCPQHGAIFRGEQVGEFLDWFERLEVASVTTLA